MKPAELSGKIFILLAVSFVAGNSSICFHDFCRLLILHFEIYFLENNLHGYHQMSKRLDPDQARHFFGPDMSPN